MHTGELDRFAPSGQLNTGRKVIWLDLLKKHIYKLVDNAKIDYLFEEREINPKDLPQFILEEVWPHVKLTKNLEKEEKPFVLPSLGDIRSKGKSNKPATPSSQKKLEKNLVKKKRGRKRDKGVRTPKKGMKQAKDVDSSKLEEHLCRLLICWFV